MERLSGLFPGRGVLMTDKATFKEKVEEFGFARLIAVMLALLAVAGWVIAAVLIETGSLNNETSTEALAETLIEAVSDEDYEAVLDLVDQSDLPLLRLLVWSAEGITPPPDEPLDDYELNLSSDVGKYIRDFFVASRERIIKNNIKSIGSRKIFEDKSYAVAIYSNVSDAPFPLMTIKGEEDWKIDMSAMIVGWNGAVCSQYVVDTVNALLEKPTKSKVDRALSMLNTSEGMPAKYSLWLEPETESLLTESARSSVADGLVITEQFSALLVKAGESSSMVSDDNDDSDDGEDKPPDSGVVKEPITFTGEGDQVTPQFELDAGTEVFHYSHPGNGRILVELVDSKGIIVAEIVNSSGAAEGSRAFGLPEGIYGLRVSASGGWTIGIEDPTPSTAPFPPQSFTAVGSRATNAFQAGGDPVTFHMRYEGEGRFTVTLMELSGNPVSLLANQEGTYSGAKLMMLSRDTFYLLDVEADGPWTISIENVKQ